MGVEPKTKGSDMSKGSRRLHLLLLCVAGLAVNFLLAKLPLALNLPLYLDNVGSALVAALGGYIPGIVVGFFSNLVNSIGAPNTTYYGSLTVLIAICSAWFAQRGYYGRPSRLPIVVVVFALIGGGLGSVLSWTLYGFQFGNSLSAPLARRILNIGELSPFWSQFAADMVIDLADKAITVAIVAIVLYVMPKTIKDRFYFAGWQQAPFTRKKLEAERKRARRMSLRSKIVCVAGVAMVVVAAGVTYISFVHFRDAAIDEQINLAYGVANVAAEAIDGDRVDEYIEKGEAAEGYARADKRFCDLVNSSENIEYVYAYRILEDGCQVVFDADTPDTPGSQPGEMVEFDEAFRDQLPTLLAGGDIKPITSNEKYGWLLTVYKPVRDSKGVCQCYVGVDINMNHIATNGYQFVARVVSLFFGFFLLILTGALWLAEYNIILPINTMDYAAETATYNSAEARARSVERIDALDIHTGDEIENLYHSVARTTEEMVETIENVEHQNAVIHRLQNGLILVLADMVESRDKCTGDHVRKTAAYVDIILRELRREGVYQDQLTEDYIRDVVNSAPLHDVGKIHVPDAILNKPGKLTDEEYEIMKTHTTAGAAVIARAIDTVSEENSGYLKEAMNLAHYHHEKWNGQGYPCGLAGEEIPLSARVMAVADVFDALVSRRSYKESFPFEKAVDIIREGSGSHFDPKVVNAFLAAQDEVRRVMNTYMGS